MSWVKTGDKGWTLRGNPTVVHSVSEKSGNILIWYINEEEELVFSLLPEWQGRIQRKPIADGVVFESEPEYTGGSVDYYQVAIKKPTTASEPYVAECNDIIEALGMNYAEGNAFKALWRRAAHRTLGKKKAGAKDDGLYDAEKVAFFGQRLVEQSKEMK